MDRRETTQVTTVLRGMFFLFCILVALLVPRSEAYGAPDIGVGSTDVSVSTREIRIHFPNNVARPGLYAKNKDKIYLVNDETGEVISRNVVSRYPYDTSPRLLIEQAEGLEADAASLTSKAEERESAAAQLEAAARSSEATAGERDAAAAALEAAAAELEGAALTLESEGKVDEAAAARSDAASKRDQASALRSEASSLRSDAARKVSEASSSRSQAASDRDLAAQKLSEAGKLRDAEAHERSVNERRNLYLIIGQTLDPGTRYKVVVLPGVVANNGSSFGGTSSTFTTAGTKPGAPEPEAKPEPGSTPGAGGGSESGTDPSTQQGVEQGTPSGGTEDTAVVGEGTAAQSAPSTSSGAGTEDHGGSAQQDEVAEITAGIGRQVEPRSEGRPKADDPTPPQESSRQEPAQAEGDTDQDEPDTEEGSPEAGGAAPESPEVGSLSIYALEALQGTGGDASELEPFEFEFKTGWQLFMTLASLTLFGTASRYARWRLS